ncbi:hypothetical protein A3B39_05455 [Candidatus Daviesbacteria bacterium RIFCSPLOWO2_01_FULL_37_10]|nr:MAG: hypothetical protein A3B39_05455 [Candidatus Daviesbacteria bacterium RIFCSPLOWO2_01_FULL_37_10]
MKNPKITVVMPVYNAQKFIISAIESILNQTLRDFELIIVNDCSTDKTRKIIESFARKDPRIKIVNNKTRMNIAASLNKGVSMASSNIIARMDADDISIPIRLEMQYRLISSDKNIAVVGANIIVMDLNENEIAIRNYPTTSEELKACLFKYSSFAHPVVCFRKSVFDEVGGYNPKYSPTEDLDLWFRLGVKHKFGNVKKPLLKYRLYNNSSSNRSLKDLEILVFKIRFDAITKYGYKPSFLDLIYNLLQFVTLWFTPEKYRGMIYNFLRNNNLI